MKKLLFYFLMLSIIVGCGGGKADKNNKEAEEQQSEMSEETIVQESMEETLPVGAFSRYAISNRTGSKFLVTEENADNRTALYRQLQYAIHNGNTYRVTFNGIQSGNEEDDNGRENYFNFENLHGALFENMDGQILPTDSDEYDGVNETILLVNQTFLDDNKLVPFTRYELEDAGKTVIETLEKKYGRKIRHAQKVISYGEKGENIFVSAQFENEGNQALGVYMTQTSGGKYAFIEFPEIVETEENGDVISVWRVDDEGYFYAPSISAVLEYGDDYMFLIDDVGAESANTYFIRQLEGKLLADDIEGRYTRYTAPD